MDNLVAPDLEVCLAVEPLVPPHAAKFLVLDVSVHLHATVDTQGVVLGIELLGEGPEILFDGGVDLSRLHAVR